MKRKIKYKFPVAVTFDTNGNGFHPVLTDINWPGWFAFDDKELKQLIKYIKDTYDLSSKDICIFELRPWD